MKQKFTALAIIIICLAIFAAVIISITSYHMPLQIVSSIEMLSDENERYAVEINLYINRFFSLLTKSQAGYALMTYATKLLKTTN